MGNVVGQIATVFTAIIGVAILAVLVSKNSQTPQVFRSVGAAGSDLLRAATGPVMGGGGAMGGFGNYSQQF
jgi:hypothetical protein